MTEGLLRIFVCYRREETRWAARALAQSIDQGLSDIELFIDVDRRSIVVGENWRTRIETAIDASDVAIVLIGDQWFDIAESNGLRKLDNPDDPVRLELEQALKRNLMVIPVRLDEARMPRAADLPASISDLVFRQGMELRHSRWDDDVQSLLESVDSLRPSLLEKRAERERAKRLEQAERERPVSGRADIASTEPARSQADSEAAARAPELGRAERELVEQHEDAKRERIAREQAERERLVDERAEQQQLAREAAERTASEQAEREPRARSWLASVSPRRKIVGSLAAVGGVIAAAWLMGVFAGSDRRPRQTTPPSAAAQTPPPPAAARTAPPLAGARTCDDGLIAGARTSCPFAKNVRAAFIASGSGILDVYSPTTGLAYRMYCTSSVPHVCAGGNGASVYFTTDNASTSTYDVSTCGGGLSVGPNTTCAFAENVRAAYFQNGPGWLSVYSPVTRRTYRMYCTSTSPHVCTGGNNAAVYFP